MLYCFALSGPYNFHLGSFLCSINKHHSFPVFFFFFLHRSQVRAKGRTQVADSGKGGRGSLLLLLTRFQKRPLKAAGPGIVSFLIVMDCQ